MMRKPIAFAAAVALTAVAAAQAAQPEPPFGVRGGVKASVAPGEYFKWTFHAAGPIESATIRLRPVREFQVLRRSPARLRGFFVRDTTPHRVLNGQLIWWVKVRAGKSRTLQLNLRVSPAARPAARLCIGGTVTGHVGRRAETREIEFCTRVRAS
jgi:hypothetical protein